MELFNITDNRVVVENLKIAENYLQRTKGLLGRKDIEENEGLLIYNCNWVHTFFMKFAVNVVFLKTQITQIEETDYADRGLYKVVKILYNIKPWRISPLIFRADSVLEIKYSTAKNIISIGDELKILSD